MPDVPSLLSLPRSGVYSTAGLECIAGHCANNAGGYSQAAWPAVNRTIYIPVQIDVPETFVQMAAFAAGTVAGNVTLGIYDLLGTRLTSASAAMAVGVVPCDIADVSVWPGVYMFAMSCDSLTPTWFRQSVNLNLCRISGVQQEATSLPATATFANPASSYMPMIVAATKTVF